MRVYLFVETRVTIVYRVSSSLTKSTTLAFTNIGSLQKFSKWNRTPKGSSNFGNVRIYIFVDTIVITVYRVVSNEKYDPRIYQHRFKKKKNFKMEPNAERLVNFW